jgi:hypothetical protein
MSGWCGASTILGPKRFQIHQSIVFCGAAKARARTNPAAQFAALERRKTCRHAQAQLAAWAIRPFAALPTLA